MNFDKKFEILTDGSDAISVYKYVKDFILCSIIDTVAVSYFSKFYSQGKGGNKVYFFTLPWGTFTTTKSFKKFGVQPFGKTGGNNTSYIFENLLTRKYFPMIKIFDKSN